MFNFGAKRCVLYTRWYGSQTGGNCGSLADASWEWVKTAWLRSWLDEVVDQKVPPVDQANVLCSHNRYGPTGQASPLFLHSERFSPWSRMQDKIG